MSKNVKSAFVTDSDQLKDFTLKHATIFVNYFGKEKKQLDLENSIIFVIILKFLSERASHI